MINYIFDILFDNLVVTVCCFANPGKKSPRFLLDLYPCIRSADKVKSRGILGVQYCCVWWIVFPAVPSARAKGGTPHLQNSTEIIMLMFVRMI